MALIFIQRYGQRVLEYLADAFSGKFSARHLNELSKDLTAPGVIELAYQEEKAPIVWLLKNDGTLCGITYRRVSRFITEAPVFAAAHTHLIGDGNRYVQSMCVLPNADGLSDLLYVCTYSFGAASDWAIEVFRPIFDDA